MGCEEPVPSRSPAALAAEAAVQALHCCKGADDGALQELLSGATHCSVQLCCGDSTLLCSGNLLAAERSTSLLASNTFASTCIAARRAKLLRE